MPSKYPDNFPAGCVDGVALMGGVENPLTTDKLKFPTIHDWTPDPAVALPKEIAQEETDTEKDLKQYWRESLCEEEWNRAVANLELGEWRPDAAWLHFLEGQIRRRTPCRELGKRFEAEEDFDLLVANVTCAVWQYFWKSNLHNRVDGIFHLAKHFRGPDLSKSQRKAINSLWGAVRKALGLPQRMKPNKHLYTDTPPSIKAASKAALSSDLIAIFRQLPGVNQALAIKWTTGLLISLEIETGSSEKISARIHAREYRSE